MESFLSIQRKELPFIQVLHERAVCPWQGRSELQETSTAFFCSRKVICFLTSLPLYYHFLLTTAYCLLPFVSPLPLPDLRPPTSDPCALRALCGETIFFFYKKKSFLCVLCVLCGEIHKGRGSLSAFLRTCSITTLNH